MAATMTYHVTGMTCHHCAGAVTGELTALGGVSSVVVDLVPGGESLVTVVSGAPLAEQAVAGALGEAGDYRLAAKEPGWSRRPQDAARRQEGARSRWARLPVTSRSSRRMVPGAPWSCRSAG